MWFIAGILQSIASVKYRSDAEVANHHRPSDPDHKKHLGRTLYQYAKAQRNDDNLNTYTYCIAQDRQQGRLCSED
jgi:hypothetical protein